MRLLVDCRWFDGPRQGVVTYIAQLHEALLDQYDLAEEQIELIYAVPKLADIDPALLPAGIEILEMGRHSLLWRLLVLPFWLHRNSIDVAHFQYVTPLYKLSCKYIVTIHDIIFITHPRFFHWRHRWARYPFYYYSSKIADVVLTVSEQSSNDIARHFRRRNVPVIHNGFTPDGRAIASEPPEGIDRVAKYLLTVGRVEPRKNYPRLVGGFEQSGLAKLGYNLIIVGHCHDEFAAERNSLIGRPGVKFLDYVEDANLIWLYENASAFIYPSICEGFGIPVLEALEQNLPVAVSTTYPLEDVKRAGVLTFDPMDVNDIASACASLVGSGSKCIATESLRETYSWRKSASKYLREILRLR